jgi:hypothetical protein
MYICPMSRIHNASIKGTLDLNREFKKQIKKFLNNKDGL